MNGRRSKLRKDSKVPIMKTSLTSDWLHKVQCKIRALKSYAKVCMRLMMLQLTMQSPRLLRYCVIRKLVHVLQAFCPTVQSRYVH